MNLAAYLSSRLYSGSSKSKSASRPVVVVAITGIALGVMAMLLSVMIVMGFRNQITEKVTGFMSHIRINRFDNNNSFEEEPISINQSFIDRIQKNPKIKSIQPYAYKACIMQANDEIQGVVLKGFQTSNDMRYFSGRLTEGHIPQLTDSSGNEILLSKTIANKLQLRCGDSFLVYFIQKDRKVRKLKVAGVYNTGLSEEFDNLYILCDLRLIQRINNWKPDQAGGFEVFLKKFDDLDAVAPLVYKEAGFSFNTQTIKEIYPQMFNWLDLQNLNMVVILTLISLVAGITMISTLLILVLENTQSIGLLKSIGASDQLISRTYLYIAVKILFRGMLIGNILGLGLAYLQLQFGILSLPEESYYLSRVPIEFTVSGILLINFVAALVCTLMLFIPSRMVSKISPVKVLRYE